MQSQHEIREYIRHLRNNLDSDYRQSASSIIAQKVIYSHWFYRAKKIACYLPIASEVDTWPIIARAWQMKKRVFVPVIEKNFRMQFHELTDDTDLFTNNLGIFEPGEGPVLPARELDVVITPLLAFDANMNRIGMGGGYFDRTFSFLRNRRSLLRPKLVGAAFASQKVEKINANPWDIRLFRVITD